MPTAGLRGSVASCDLTRLCLSRVLPLCNL